MHLRLSNPRVVGNLGETHPLRGERSSNQHSWMLVPLRLQITAPSILPYRSLVETHILHEDSAAQIKDVKSICYGKLGDTMVILKTKENGLPDHEMAEDIASQRN
jgi:hypothetical protein